MGMLHSYFQLHSTDTSDWKMERKREAELLILRAQWRGGPGSQSQGLTAGDISAQSPLVDQSQLLLMV